MVKRYLECGKIVSTHGVRGEVKVQHWCDTPEFLLNFDTLYFEQGKQPVKVEGARVHKGMVLLKLAGIDTLDAAVTLRGRILYIDREDAPEEEGRYFIQDLLGMTVSDADSGVVYGKLTDVIATGANDVYEITTPEGKKLLAPAIPQVVVETDVAGGNLRIRPLKGLFDDAD
ncbi:MAG TPA: 16S rRNA processing protein RimM [Clostridiales bacterium]|nr:16S rRNA processing protein RimM [Clostridiales bacterium]